MKCYKVNLANLVGVICDECGKEVEVNGKYPVGWHRVDDPEGGDICPACWEEDQK